MNNPPDLTPAEVRYLATHPVCLAIRRRADRAASDFFRSLFPRDEALRDAAIAVLATFGLDIAIAEREALEDFRAERRRKVS